MTIQEANTGLARVTKASDDDLSLDVTLRPRSLGDFVGQPKLKESLAVFLSAARERGDALEHVLLAGPPGLGKTSLAHIIAREMSSSIRVTSGPALTKVADLAGILTNLQKGDVFFIDEIHRLQKSIEEVLYPAMEDFALDLVVGQGPGARTLRLDLPPFTLVGATTRVGMLGSPLRDRFGMTYRLDFYGEDDMVRILNRSAALLDLTCDDLALREVAQRCRQTPRIANRLLKRIRDYAQVHQYHPITQDVVRAALDILEIDSMGLDGIDRRTLEIMIDHFDGGPVGLQTLAAVLSEEKRTLEEVVEPFLLQCGFLQRTPRGRVVTEAGRNHVENL